MDGDGEVALADALFLLKVSLGAEEINDSVVEECNRYLVYEEWLDKFEKEFWAGVPDDEWDKYEGEYWRLRQEAYNKIMFEGELDFALGL